jgi:hypothetical protein
MLAVVVVEFMVVAPAVLEVQVVEVLVRLLLHHLLVLVHLLLAEVVEVLEVHQFLLEMVVQELSSLNGHK